MSQSPKPAAPHGKYLVFSQDSSKVAIAKVTANGLLQDYAQVKVPANTSFITCFPNSPTASYGNPCGALYSPSTSYPVASPPQMMGRAPMPC